MKVSLPYEYQPRSYQVPVWEAFDAGRIKRFYTLWHRRSGKDINWWNLIVREAATGPVGLYYHFLPTSVQGRQVIWDGITNDGRRFLSYVPEGLVSKRNEQEMKIEFKRGSIVRVIGTDHYDSIRGTNPIGCVFSEFAYQHPMAWETVKPILNANGGWAAFDTTPNGNNHAKKVWTTAQDNPGWFTSCLTVTDTGIVSDAVIASERRDGTPEEMIQQEYYCSFDAGAVGSYYADQVSAARREGRVTDIDPGDDPVHVFMDLGKNDTTSIGFIQERDGMVRVVDYYENHGKDIPHYTKVISEKPFRLGTVYLPHDAFAKRLESPQTIAEQFQSAGFTVERVPGMSIINGVQLVRRMFSRMAFDKANTPLLLDALESYRKEYDPLNKVYREAPVHDWSSHPSDMVRYAAVIFEGAKDTDTATEERSRVSAIHASDVGVKDDFQDLDRQMRLLLGEATTEDAEREALNRYISTAIEHTI